MSQHTFTSTDNKHSITLNLRPWDSDTHVGYEGFIDVALYLKVLLADLIYRFTVGGLSTAQRILVAAGRMAEPAMSEDQALDLLLALNNGQLSAEEQRDAIQRLRGMGMEFTAEIDGKPVKAHLDWIFAGDKAKGAELRQNVRLTTEVVSEKAPAPASTIITNRVNLPI